MTMPPRLVAIEGIDGSGKTTQAAAFAARLSPYLPVMNARVQSFGARSIYRLAEQLTGDPLAYHPMIPASLREFTFACDIAQYAQVEICPALTAGTTVIWDRGPLSYLGYAQAYEGATEWVTRVHTLFPQPDVTILLDLPADEAVARLRERHDQPHQTDEAEPLLARARALLLNTARERPDVIVVDARQCREIITDVIMAAWEASHLEAAPGIEPR